MRVTLLNAVLGCDNTLYPESEFVKKYACAATILSLKSVTHRLSLGVHSSPWVIQHINRISCVTGIIVPDK